MFDRNQLKSPLRSESKNGGDSQLVYPAILASKYNNVVAVGASWGTENRHGQSVIPGQRIS